MRSLFSKTLLLLVALVTLVGPACHARDVTLWFYGPGYIGGQTSINIAPNGEIWAANGSQIAIYGPDGVFKRTENNYSAQDGIVWVDGDVVGIMFQAGATRYHGDQRIPYQATWSGYGPRDVTLDDKGFMYITDGGSHSVKKFDPRAVATSLVQEFKSPADPALKVPYSAAVDSNGRVFVSDEQQPGIWIFKPDGTFEKRIFTDRTAFKIRSGPAGMYTLTTRGMLIFNPTTGAIVKEWPTLPGVQGDISFRGFAVDRDGNFYIGHQYHQIFKFSPEGKLIQTISASYYSSLTVPDAYSPGQTVTAPLTVEVRTDKPVGKIPPSFSFSLEPAFIRSEADLGARTAEQAPKELEGTFDKERLRQIAAKVVTLASTQDAKSVAFTMPADLNTNLYRLKIHADNGTAGGVNDQELTVRVAGPGAAAGLTLFSPRQRSVFQQGEAAEVDAILRSKAALPAGTLTFSLVPRQANSLEYQPGAAAWKTFPTPPGAAATLTFNIDAATVQAGRYLLQAEWIAGGQTMRDTWPLQIVDKVETTRFNILLPEWGAGYTNLTGPFSGRGMQADAAMIGHEGLTLVDEDISSKTQTPPVTPDYGAQQTARALEDQAAAEPSLPAPERFMTPSYLEVELQEALRNHFNLQRDIWGGWSMMDWAYGTQLGIDRDNRHAQIWTEVQREWPSWIGHRYLSLSAVDQSDQEAKAVQQSLGLRVPTAAEVSWAYNGQQHHLVTDSPAGSVGWWSGGGEDAMGNIYIGRGDGVLCYGPDGHYRWKAPASCLNDLCVAPDGTVYGASIEGHVSVTGPDRQVRTFICQDFSGHSPRGICLAPDGSLLITDQADNGSGRAKVVRYSPAGKFLALVADKRVLKSPEGVSCFKDGTIVVADPGRGGLVFLKPDGGEIKFIPVPGIGTAGGKSPVVCAPDGTIWVARGQWGYIDHIDQDGKSLGTIGHHTLALGAVGFPTGLGLKKDGELLVGDVGTAWVTEFKPDGLPTGRLFGIGSLVVDLRIDRERYAWNDKILVTAWAPLPETAGDPHASLQVFAAQVGAGAPTWTALPVTSYTRGEFTAPAPRLEGKVTLRLVWGTNALPDDPRHVDFAIGVSETTSGDDRAKLEDIRSREVNWKESWARARMGALVRWTALSNRIRPGTQDTAPGNYGGWESVSGAVWPPYRTAALAAEAENVGHDAGAFPLMGAFNVARFLAGAHPLPAWSSLLETYWNKPDTYHRPLRDTVALLGAGASGIGVGIPANVMNASQLALQRKIVAQLRQIGDACTQLGLPGEGGVAVLHGITQEAMAPDWYREQFYSAHAAWYDLQRAHIPTAVVNEETIELDGGKAVAERFKAILLPDLRFSLPPATMAALANFQRLGGEVWVDLSCRVDIPGAKLLKTHYWPFWVQEAYFTFIDYGGLGYDGNFEHFRMRQGSDYRLPAVKDAFGRWATMPVSTADANVYMQQRRGGAVTYVFAENTHFPDKPLIETSIHTQEPVPAVVQFTLTGGAVYDVFAMKRVTEKSSAIDFTDEAPARIWAVLPHPIAGVSLKAAQVGDRLFARAGVIDTTGKLAAGVVPLEFTVADPGGNIVQHLWRSTDRDGQLRIEIPVEWGVRPGVWMVTARELLSGLSAEPAHVTVTQRPPAVMTAVASAAMVFDQPALSAWLKTQRGHEVWIGLGAQQQALRPIADDLAVQLNALGILARVVNTADVPALPMRLTYDPLTQQQKIDIAKIMAGEAIGMRSCDDYSGSAGPVRAICRPLILLGQPAQNEWLNDIDSLRLYRRPLLPDYPGPDRALVQYVWAPFYDGFDAVCITGTTTDGVKAGIKALLAL